MRLSPPCCWDRKKNSSVNSGLNNYDFLLQCVRIISPTSKGGGERKDDFKACNEKSNVAYKRSLPCNGNKSQMTSNTRCSPLRKASSTKDL